MIILVMILCLRYCVALMMISLLPALSLFVGIDTRVIFILWYYWWWWRYVRCCCCSLMPILMHLLRVMMMILYWCLVAMMLHLYLWWCLFCWYSGWFIARVWCCTSTFWYLMIFMLLSWYLFLLMNFVIRDDTFTLRVDDDVVPMKWWWTLLMRCTCCRTYLRCCAADRDVLSRYWFGDTVATVLCPFVMIIYWWWYIISDDDLMMMISFVSILLQYSCCLTLMMFRYDEERSDIRYWCCYICAVYRHPLFYAWLMISFVLMIRLRYYCCVAVSCLLFTDVVVTSLMCETLMWLYCSICYDNGTFFLPLLQWWCSLHCCTDESILLLQYDVY